MLIRTLVGEVLGCMGVRGGGGGMEERAPSVGESVLFIGLPLSSDASDMTLVISKWNGKLSSST